MRIVVSLPFGDHERTLFAHGSPPALLTGAGVKVACTVPCNVGRGTEVFVGNSVGLAVSVGGNGVAVGIAACVSATIVNAAATAVNCTSAALIVGAAGAPHALIITVIAAINEEIAKCFMLLSIS